MRIRWRGLQLPSQVTCDQESLTINYGKFSVEPFERGFGVTVGNSLRRILLSSLEGSAITRMKIQGVQHEFTTLPGVVEDVTDLVLNVKSLIVKNHSEQKREIRIEKNTRGVVTGADIITDEAIDIINPDHVIATLTDDVPFVLEMTVDNGRGYVAATDFASLDQEVGVIPIDAVYSPVVRVKYDIEETRVGQRTNYDKLIMEICTNGTVGPEMALVESAKILRKHLNPFLQYHELGPTIHVKASTLITSSGQDAALESKLGMTIVDLRLSVRATNCLESENISTVRDLVQRNEDDLLEVRNFGETTLREVKQRLQEIGLRLGMKLPSSSNA